MSLPDRKNAPAKTTNVSASQPPGNSTNTSKTGAAPSKNGHSQPSPRKISQSRNFLDRKLQSGDINNIKPLTAEQFLDIWKHYDVDANRVLERDEVAQFFWDFMTSCLGGADEEKLTRKEVDEYYEVFMQEFDENGDGKISIQELALILPVEDGFFTLLRNGASFGTAADYMKVWKEFDKNFSGFIEPDELKDFIGAVLRRANPDLKLEPAQLKSYAKTIMVLYNFDNDGRLGLSELIRLLPSSQNFIQEALNKAQLLQTITEKDIDLCIKRYDSDGSHTLEGTELLALIRDLLRTYAGVQDYNVRQVEDLRDALLKACDRDRDGKIDTVELKTALLAIVKSGLSGIAGKR